MKMPLKKLCALIAILCISISASAYNFEVDGIYYNITSDSTCSVTYKTNANSYHGDVNIPKSVIHNDINYTITKIDLYAFEYCDELKSVTIPNTVTSICKQAFYDSSIKKVVIPNSVTEIGDKAFAWCTDLSSVSIPDKISVIGNDLFNSCYSLTSISIPNSVTSIGERAFRGTGLTSVTIPNSVTSIGEWAFTECSDLVSVEIPNSITSISLGLFEFCSKLENVILPSNLTAIGGAAFHNCGFTSFTIPNTVTKIDGGAFCGCRNLTSIVIPNSIASLPSGVFWDSGLTSIIIPNSVTEIGEMAFYDCVDLLSVEMPNSITTIAESAFEGCSSLTSISIPNSVTNIKNRAFYGCQDLTDVIIGNSVSRIGEYAFYQCSSLKELTIPKSVASIDLCAFRECNLRCIECLPTTPPKINISTFDDYQATLIVYNDKYKSTDYWKDFSNIVIDYTPEDATFEVDGLKYDVVSINDLTCKLYKISDDKSGDIVVPQTVNYKNRDFKILEINGIIAKSRKDIKSIEIPSGITISNTLLVNSTIERLSLGSNVSYKVGCESNIGEVVIKPEVSEFNFDNLSTANINKLTIEDGEAELSVKKTSDYDKPMEIYFGRPMNFTKVSFPAVETISFGTYITSINNGAFKNDTAIRTVISNNPVPPTTDDTFSNSTYLDGVLYVPEYSINDYAAAPGWKNFWEIKSLDEFNGVGAIRVNDATTYSVSDGALHIVGDAPVRVVAINGAVVYSGKGDSDINLNKGMYIVVLGDKASKIVVR